MKATLLLTLLTTLQVSANLYSQDSKLTLDIKDKPLSEVIKTIEQQSSYRFFYSDNYRELGEKVSIDVKDKKIEEVLSNLLNDKSLDFRVLNNNIIVIAPTKAFQQQKITGIVTDASNGDPLPGVTVMIEGTGTGAMTDANGKYSIEVSQPDVVLVFSYLGYNAEKVKVQGQQSVDVKLVPDIKKLDEVVVIGYGTMKRSDLTGSVGSITAETIEKSVPTTVDQ
ncbi:MAG TPA: carboxypeptidase-like regulatory domain-containing protein, partial [Bacteroidales bacterium]